MSRLGTRNNVCAVLEGSSHGDAISSRTMLLGWIRRARTSRDRSKKRRCRMDIAAEPTQWLVDVQDVTPPDGQPGDLAGGLVGYGTGLSFQCGKGVIVDFLLQGIA